MIERNNSEALIEVDGGVSRDNLQQIIDAGADAVVAGNAVFRSQDPAAEIAYMKSL